MRAPFRVVASPAAAGLIVLCAAALFAAEYFQPQTTTTEYKKVKGSDAKKICASTKYESTASSTSGTATTRSQQISETNCELK